MKNEAVISRDKGKKKKRCEAYDESTSSMLNILLHAEWISLQNFAAIICPSVRG